MKLGSLILIAASAGLTAGCTGAPTESLTPVAVTEAMNPPAFSVDRLIGGWGVA